jgi:hypothetical protein
MLRVFFVLLAFMPSLAHAEKRVALVMGNSAYQHAPKLLTPEMMPPTWRPY